MSGNPQEAKSTARLGKQFVKFGFFRLHDDVRRAMPKERAALGQELISLLDRSSKCMLTRTYTTVGTRADTDFLIWQVSEALPPMQDWHAKLLSSPLGWALERPYSYLSMTMRSVYSNPLHQLNQSRETLREDGGLSNYLFVYPMVKTRAWYELSLEERQRIMEEHIAVGHRYHNIKINTTYSYGLDDQEFVVAFECDNPGEFLALVRDLRNTESSSYTQQDTPMFTCRRMSPAELPVYIGLGPPAE